MDSPESQLNRALIARDLHGCPVSGELLQITGADSIILQDVCGELSRHTDDLRGYKPLSEYFAEGTTLRHWLGESLSHGLCKEVIELASLYICTSTTRMDGQPWSEPRYVSIRSDQPKVFARLHIFFVKSGQWIVWTNDPICKFIFCPDASAAVKAAYDLITEGSYIGGNAWTKIDSLALLLARDLYRKHVESSNEAERQLACERRTQSRVQGRLQKYMCL